VGARLAGEDRVQQGCAGGRVQVSIGQAGLHDVGLHALEAFVSTPVQLDHGGGPLQHLASSGSGPSHTHLLEEENALTKVRLPLTEEGDHAFRSDTKAEGETAVLGGWCCSDSPDRMKLYIGLGHRIA